MSFGSSSAAFRVGVKPARARMDNVPTNKRDMVGLREYGKTWQRHSYSRQPGRYFSLAWETSAGPPLFQELSVIPVYWPEGFTRKGNSPARQPREEVLDGHLGHLPARFLRGAAQVRRDDHVIEFQQRVVARQRFRVGHVERRGVNLACRQGLGQRVLVHDRPRGRRSRASRSASSAPVPRGRSVRASRPSAARSARRNRRLRAARPSSRTSRPARPRLRRLRVRLW